MNLEILGNIVAKVAPVLGGALAGPAGAAVGSLIAAKFGGNVNEPDDLIQRIEADPNAQVKLLELQTNYLLEQQRIQAQIAADANRNEEKLYELEVQDKDSARKNHAATLQAGQKDYMPAVVSCWILLVYALVQFCHLFIHPVDATDLNSVADFVFLVLGYWLGSSARERHTHKTQNNLH